MTRIDKVTVTGLAGSSEPFTATLSPGINILFGGNGSGKTTLLKLMSAALDCNASRVKHAPFTSATIKAYSHNADASATLSLTKGTESDDDDDDEVLSWDPWTHQPTTTVSKHEWTIQLHGEAFPKAGLKHAFLQTSRLLIGGEVRNIQSTTQSEEHLDKMFQRVIEGEWLSYWADIQARLRLAQEQGFQEIVREILSKAPDQDQKVSTKATYRQLASMARQGSATGELIDEKALARRLSQHPTLNSVVQHIQRVEETHAQILGPVNKLIALLGALYQQKRVTIVDNKLTIEGRDRRSLKPARLSSGEKHVLRILFTALKHNDRSCIIIDEPELSLHIDWQRTLLQHLQALAPSCQIIVATHSPEIMAEFPDKNIHAIAS